MASILFLGFFIGMHHALEADHVAVVASVSAGERSVSRVVRHGVVWGIGHTVTLLVVGGGVVLLGAAVPSFISGGLAQGLEAAVGVMLIALGGHVLYRLVRDRIHFHLHRHSGGVSHLHAHSHLGEQARHNPNRHSHEHTSRFPVRTLLVGMMHGMAGSAALLVLTAASIGPSPLGLFYVALFGVGSIIGMAALSVVIAVPLAYTAKSLTWGNWGLQSLVGAGTVILGVVVVVNTIWA
ncbi:MAG: urease accessory protein [Rhodospirillales bacterium]|nr:urease accessory protein [Rhodospirillales bacterium]